MSHTHPQYDVGYEQARRESEATIGSIRADLATERTAREKAERERDEYKMTCDKVTDVANKVCLERDEAVRNLRTETYAHGITLTARDKYFAEREEAVRERDEAVRRLEDGKAHEQHLTDRWRNEVARLAQECDELRVALANVEKERDDALIHIERLRAGQYNHIAISDRVKLIYEGMLRLCHPVVESSYDLAVRCGGMLVEAEMVAEKIGQK